MVRGVRDHLIQAIRPRSRADVPVGVYLLGVASVVAYLLRGEGAKLRNQVPTAHICCFSIEFPHESGVDETLLAENFADSVYHSEYHSLDLHSVGKFALPTLVRENGCKVVLTGEGADEHFAGYSYFSPDFVLGPDHSMPDSTLALNNELRKAPPLVLFAPWVGRKWAGLDWRFTPVKALPPDVLEKVKNKWHPLHSSQYLWIKSLLANFWHSSLGDRTEMAHSIEARPPYLDHILSECVNGLPPSLRLGYTPEKSKEERDQGPFWDEAFGRASKRKYPYMAPTRWPKDGPVHKKLREICTREAVESLGFVDSDVIESALSKGFGDDANLKSFRQLLAVGAWITIGERFEMKTAKMGD
ncbi:hypothetical protein B0H67DRAFT_596434 [Lasiosphaeris hirsuta]|uniref:Asparagine synthetase domain-containing protein n=1 Tax=Lasiosphaeris hirsuta TaxID=260670 RepID=A0AA40E7W8_9PEZI|nr:hypothetical protein B0H67DRAFT_596434 [Lasiosphaeris hirsuta]